MKLAFLRYPACLISLVVVGCASETYVAPEKNALARFPAMSIPAHKRVAYTIHCPPGYSLVAVFQADDKIGFMWGAKPLPLEARRKLPLTYNYAGRVDPIYSKTSSEDYEFLFENRLNHAVKVEFPRNGVITSSLPQNQPSE